MIDEIIKQKKEVILSSGLSSFRELDKTVERIKNRLNYLFYNAHLSIQQILSQ